MKSIVEFLVKDHVKQSLYHPKNKKELIEMIGKVLNETGISNCDLNCIDTSDITDMSELFSENSDFVDFNGDISKWDVSSVKNMGSMFQGSDFDGDISKWNVSNCEDMTCMFMGASFDGDISKWNVSKVKHMTSMFEESSFSGKHGDLSKWKINKDCKFDEMFSRTTYDDSGKSPKWYRDYMNKIYG